MSQYDFGTIDPFVVDGTGLAGMLNGWRDALYSLHRGATRPDYAVPGLMWINDVGGPTNWVVNIYLGPSVGDRPILQINTTTGAIANVADQITAAMLTAQAAAGPAFVWNATGNAANQKLWKAVLLASGVLEFQALNDAQAVLAAIDFNRDGTMRVVAPAPGDNSTLVPTTAWVKANAGGGGVAVPTYDASTVGMASGTNWWPAGDVPMQITQGAQVFSRSFTAVDATHPVEVDALVWLFSPNASVSHGIVALFIDGVAAAVAQGTSSVPAGSWGSCRVYWQGVLAAGAHTFAVRFGSTSTAGMYTMMNDVGHAGGGAERNTMTIREIGIGPRGPAGPVGVPAALSTYDTTGAFLTDAGTLAGGSPPNTAMPITGGQPIFSRSFTATDATRPIEVCVDGFLGAAGAAAWGVIGLFIDGAAAAVAQGECAIGVSWGQTVSYRWRGVLAAGAHTFALRFGGQAAAVYLNGYNAGTPTGIGGGALRTTMTIREVV